VTITARSKSQHDGRPPDVAAGIDHSLCSPAGGSTEIGPLTMEAHIEVCIQHRVPVVTFFWTPPPDEWARRLKEAKCDVWLQTRSASPPRGPWLDEIGVHSDYIEHFAVR
jgi:hypothetical protein